MLALDLTTIIFEMINFLVLTALLYRFLFQPVVRNVQARADEKQKMMQNLAREGQEAKKIRAELETRLAHIDEEAVQIRARTEKEIAEERAEILEQVHQEAERILVEAHRDAHLWRQQAVKDFHDELLKTILDISGAAIGSAAPPELHDSLVEQLNERIWEMGRHEIQRVDAIRRALGERAPTAYVTTAHPLSPEQQNLLTRTFSALADRNVKLEAQTDPALALGLRVRLGDIMIDNSLAGQLNELRDRVSDQLEAQMQSNSRVVG